MLGTRSGLPGDDPYGETRDGAAAVFAMLDVGQVYQQSNAVFLFGSLSTEITRTVCKGGQMSP